MRLPRASLAVGLGLDLVIAVLACAAALLVSLSLQLDRTQSELRQHSLEAAARYADRHLQVAPDGTLRLPHPPGSSWASFGYPTLVFGRDGRVLYKRPSDLSPATVAALFDHRLPATAGRKRRGAIHFFRLTLGEQRIIGGALPVGSGPDARIIEVFKDENAPDVLVDDVVREFPYRSVRVLLPLLALLLLAGGVIVWRRMRPIAEVSAIAATIGPDTLNLRLPERDLPGEVLPIVRGVNGAFARLERAAEAQRDFLRRAAHQLRTPMTVLIARAARLDDAETAAQLRGDVRALSRIVSQLLQLNELDALPRGAALADLGAVAEAVHAELAPLAAEQNQQIALERSPVMVLVRGDPNVIEVAVRNLVENALQHAPAGSRIDLRVSRDASIAVADAGPGVSTALHDTIFEPFWSDDPQGGRAGLGLAIVRRVAERYAASATVAAAPGGGALFTLRFQPAAAGEGEFDPATAASSIPASLIQQRRRAARTQAAD